MLYRHQDFQANQHSNTAKRSSMQSTPQPASSQAPLAANQGNRATGVTEIVLPAHHSLDIILPSLAFLSRNKSKTQNSDRWLTWLAPKGLCKEMLADYGFDLASVRFIHPKNDEQCVDLFNKALAEGNSHTVVASPNSLTEKQLEQLENSSAKGQCSGLILRQRIA